MARVEVSSHGLLQLRLGDPSKRAQRISFFFVPGGDEASETWYRLSPQQDPAIEQHSPFGQDKCLWKGYKQAVCSYTDDGIITSRMTGSSSCPQRILF